MGKQCTLDFSQSTRFYWVTEPCSDYHALTASLVHKLEEAGYGLQAKLLAITPPLCTLSCGLCIDKRRHSSAASHTRPTKIFKGKSAR